MDSSLLRLFSTRVLGFHESQVFLSKPDELPDPTLLASSDKAGDQDVLAAQEHQVADQELEQVLAGHVGGEGGGDGRGAVGQGARVGRFGKS